MIFCLATDVNTDVIQELIASEVSFKMFVATEPACTITHIQIFQMSRSVSG